MNRSKELKIGAVIAYLTIAINIVSGLLYTPWIVKQIGDSDYGLYTLANSLINLFLFDFGLSAATSRFVSKYLAEGRQDKVDCILGAIYKLYFIIDAIICIVLVVISVFLEQIYTNLTPLEIQRFRVVFIISAVFAVINFPCVTFTGILNAYEKFITLKIADALYRIFSVLITVVALLCNGGLYALVCVNTIVGVLVLAFKLFVIKSKTPIKINFSYKGKGMVGDLLGFSLWVTISTLAQRLIFGITPSILGIVSSTAAIAVFGIVSLMENYIHLVTTALNGMFMPRISRILTEENYTFKLNSLIVKVGRFQFALHGLIVTGFLLLGKDFILLWLDESYSMAYYGILFVTIPSLFYYSLQIANTAVMMKNRVRIQAITNVAVGIINVILAFIWSGKYGVLGACAAIFVAYNVRNIGYFIAYHKILKMDIKKLFTECYIPLGICMAITIAFGVGVNYLIPHCDWMSLMIKATIILVLYFALIFIIGATKNERRQMRSIVLRMVCRRKK
ncbi:MAG: oligosaccharide flippase family protein [Clostridia bacterium]|nr:oligosaccharide flippase family protein [Clostridia bacterium]